MVPSGTMSQPDPIVIKFYDAICHQGQSVTKCYMILSWIMAAVSHNEFQIKIGQSLLCLLMVKHSEVLGYPQPLGWSTVYPKKYAHGFVVLCFVVVMQSFITNSHEVFIHFHQGCFAGTGAIVRLPQCQWSKPDGYGKISQCITTTKHSKAKTVCIFLGIYCSLGSWMSRSTTGKYISFEKKIKDISIKNV